jgi:hypothetical protein
MQRVAASSLLGIFGSSVPRMSRALIAPTLTYETSVRSSFLDLASFACLAAIPSSSQRIVVGWISDFRFGSKSRHHAANDRCPLFFQQRRYQAVIPRRSGHVSTSTVAGPCFRVSGRSAPTRGFNHRARFSALVRGLGTAAASPAPWPQRQCRGFRSCFAGESKGGVNETRSNRAFHRCGDRLLACRVCTGCIEQDTRPRDAKVWKESWSSCFQLRSAPPDAGQ